MKLEPLTLDQCQQVRTWRNECLETLRTPYPLTEQQQEAFYRDVVCDRNSPHRYWAIVRTVDDPIQGVVPESGFLGMGGITNIQRENRIGEISLIIAPDRRGQGEGEKAVALLLDMAFNYLNLRTVFGEVYACNDAVEFWKKITTKYTKTNFQNWLMLRNRKFWNGVYYAGFYFTIDKADFNAKKNNSTGR